MQTVHDHAPRYGVRPTCAALAVAPATDDRHRPGGDGSSRVAPTRHSASPRALAPVERPRVLAVLHEPRLADRAPATVSATLLDKGTYHCSERTMYRVLAAHDEVRARRAQRRHPTSAAPELLATAPHQLWSWDITRLTGPEQWTYCSLDVRLDGFVGTSSGGSSRRESPLRWRSACWP